MELIGKGSLEAAEQILEGKQKPTVFSPADSLALNVLVDDWSTKYHGALVATEGDDAPQPLLLSPLVFAVWEDRADVLLKAAGGRSAGRRSTRRWPRPRAGRRSAASRTGASSSSATPIRPARTRGCRRCS